MIKINAKKWILLALIATLPSSVFGKGVLIEICGIDGAGKTTLAAGLKEKMSINGAKVVVLQPNRGDASFYPFLSAVSRLSNKDQQLKTPIAEFKNAYFSLYLLTQKESLEKALEENDYVILDRYLASYKAYQAAFDQKTTVFDEALNALPKVDFTFLLSIPVDVALERIQARGLFVQSYENKSFLTKAQTALFKQNAKIDKAHFIHKSGTSHPDTLVQEALCFIKPKKHLNVQKED